MPLPMSMFASWPASAHTDSHACGILQLLCAEGLEDRQLAAPSLCFLIKPCVDGAYHPFLDHPNEQELSPNNRHVSIPVVVQYSRRSCMQGSAGADTTDSLLFFFFI